MRGQREVPQMVGTELQLESVAGPLKVGRCHHAGVVDQDVDGAALGDESFTRGSDAVQRRQIGLAQAQCRCWHMVLELREGVSPLGEAADGEDDVSSRLRQPLHQPQPEAAVGTGHHGEPPGQIGHLESEAASHHVTGNS